MGGRLGGEVFLGWAEPAGGKEGEEKGVLWMPRLRQVEGQSEQSPCGRSLQGGLHSWRQRVRGWRPVADGRVLIGLVSSVSKLVAVLEAFEEILDLTWAQKVRV